MYFFTFQRQRRVDNRTKSEKLGQFLLLNDKSEEESLHYLRQAIHEDLQTDLENEKVRGFRSNLSETCLLYLREIIFGTMRERAMN